MGYNHLTIYERGRIEELYNLGYSIRKIAKRLHRSPSTISREIRNNSQNNSYRGDVAQSSYKNRKKSCVWLGTLTAGSMEHAIKNCIQLFQRDLFSQQPLTEVRSLLVMT